MSTKPTVGRIVHYRSYGTPGGEYTPQCRAAIVTEADAHTGDVGLAVFNPTGIFLNRGIPQHEIPADDPDTGYAGGTWHWPCVLAGVNVHSRACGIRPHDHGTACASDCPTCGGRPQGGVR